ncbi:DUF2617 family protein [Longispora albida]|uniref:DUF2617 family protein n=1 Tax=Longispora albida TaxID=203523 RepID=UPI00035F9119|nr:DUF2617 family protein [Longispora albida]
MITTISVPYVDTSAAELSFRLGGELIEPLDALVVSGHGYRLELRLLGASHQAILEWDRPGGPLVETVACLPGDPAPLPGRFAEGRYTFASEVRALDPARLGRLKTRPGALVGIFPGSPDALTALAAEASGGLLRWRTWHAYPQSGELAVTSTTVELQ